MIASRIVFLALLSGLVNALPYHARDSSVNEPAVAAPNGVPMTITEGSQPAPTPVDNNSSGSWDGSSMGYGGSSGSYGGSSGSYGGSSGSYGGSSGSYGGSNMGSSGDMGSMSSKDESWGGSSMSWSAGMDSTSTMDATSTADSMSTMDSMSTSTSSAWNSYQTPSYGSGSSNWGSSSSGYDNCVSQCMAQYGNPPPALTPPTQSTSGSSSSTGGGATHVVLVGPAPGVNRYLPSFLNASVGDTVHWKFMSDTHTVTHSSELTPCNKTSDGPFTSGPQSAGATFDQRINTTDTVFFYCGIPGHCQDGMFGIINPPNAAGAPTSVSMMMPGWIANNSDIAAYAAYTANLTQGNLAASNWGGNMDVGSAPQWSHQYLAENIMFTRGVMALNPAVMAKDGTLDLSSVTNTTLQYPKSMDEVLSSAGAGAGASTISSPVEAPSVAAAGASETTSAASDQTPSANLSNSNGAITTAPRFVIALAVATASFLLL